MAIGDVKKHIVNNLTGNVEKALLIIQKDMTLKSDPLEVGRKAADALANISSTGKMGAAIKNLGFDDFHVLQVQFNPSSIHFSANADPIAVKYMQQNFETDLPNQHERKESVVMQVDLIFDAVNNTDAFLGDKIGAVGALSLPSALGVAANIKKNATSDGYTVKPQTNAILATLLDQSSSVVTFKWADISFTGYIRQAQAKYTMFSPSGKPIRSQISIEIDQVMNDSAEIEYWKKAFENCFGSINLGQAAIGDAQGAAGALVGDAVGALGAPPIKNELKYEALVQKYSNFAFPTAKIVIKHDLSKIKEIVGVTEILVDLSSDYEASIASFKVSKGIDSESIFNDESIKKELKLGEAIEISMGYKDQQSEAQVLEKVFHGFVAEISYCYSAGLPYIEVTALDVKGLMMENSYYKQLKAKTYENAVKEIFEQARYSPLTSKVNVGIRIGANKENIPTMEMIGESDYEFIVKIAKKLNYEFFIDRGEVNFRRAKKIDNSIAKLSNGKGIKNFNLSFSITGIVKNVEARAVDVSTGKPIISKKTNCNTLPNSSSVSKVTKNSKKILVDETIMTKDDAEMRAKTVLEKMEYNLGTLNCECVGIPDLVPGRFANIEINSPADNKFYITNVKHTFATGVGFTTHLIGKTANTK